MKPRLGTLISALAIAAVMTVGVAACAPVGGGDTGGTGGSSAPSAAPIPTGTSGAADFDGGFLTVGSGATVVDVYFDPMCPICGVFDKTNGAQLSSFVDDGTITLRLHPMNFLNRLSQGTEYSTRAGGALTCVAVADPTKTLPYLTALFDDQPEEGSAGIDDAALVKLASDLGVSDISECVTTQAYGSWVQHINDAALAGPIEGADIPKVEGTPTVLVNGNSFTGQVNDAKGLAAFITAG